MKTLIILLSCSISFSIVSAGSGPPAFQHAVPVAMNSDPERTLTKILAGIPLTERRKADDYSGGGHWLVLWNFVNVSLIAWIFFFRGLSAHVKKIAAGNSLFYISLYFVLSYLLCLPLNIYQHFFREKQFGFLNQRFTQWFSEDLQKFMIELIILTPFFVWGYVSMTKRKKDVRIYGMAIPLVLLNIQFEYRILILLGFLLVIRMFKELVLTYGMQLLVLLLGCYFFIATPVVNTIKRRFQMEADIYSLNTGRKPDAFILSVLKSADREKVDPGLWEELFFFDHLSIKERILIARKWEEENFIFLPLFDIRQFRC